MTTITSSKTGMTYEWNGLHTINVFDHDGANIDCISLNYATEYPSVDDVYSAIDGWELDWFMYPEEPM